VASATRWALTYYAHAWLGPILYVYAETDVPVHLYLRWTDKEEQIHLHTEVDRGLAKLGDPKYCFVQWREVEQNEPGDTISHTFSFAGWAHCNWRWWMFRGTAAGADTPSNTCIFSAHYLDQEKAVSLKHTDLLEKEVAGVIDHADRSITPIKLAEIFNFLEFPLTPVEAPTFNYEVANKKYVDDSIPESTLQALQAKDFHLIDNFTHFNLAPPGAGGATLGHTIGHVWTGTDFQITYAAYLDAYLRFNGSTPTPTWNWDNPFTLTFFAAPKAADAAVDRFSWMRMSVDITSGDLSQPGVGWRYNRNGYKLYAQSHDGGNLSSTLVSSGVDIHSRLHRFRIEHDPPIGVHFYLDDAFLCTNGYYVPAGEHTNSSRFSIGAYNASSFLDQAIFCNRILFAGKWR